MYHSKSVVVIRSGTTMWVSESESHVPQDDGGPRCLGDGGTMERLPNYPVVRVCLAVKMWLLVFGGQIKTLEWSGNDDG